MHPPTVDGNTLRSLADSYEACPRRVLSTRNDGISFALNRLGGIESLMGAFTRIGVRSSAVPVQAGIPSTPFQGNSPTPISTFLSMAVSETACRERRGAYTKMNGSKSTRARLRRRF